MAESTNIRLGLQLEGMTRQIEELKAASQSTLAAGTKTPQMEPLVFARIMESSLGEATGENTAALTDQNRAMPESFDISELGGIREAGKLMATRKQHKNPSIIVKNQPGDEESSNARLGWQLKAVVSQLEDVRAYADLMRIAEEKADLACAAEILNAKNTYLLLETLSSSIDKSLSSLQNKFNALVSDSYIKKSQLEAITRQLKDVSEDADRARETASHARAAEALKTKSLAEIREQLKMQEAMNIRLAAEVEVLASQRKEHKLLRWAGRNGEAFGLRENGALPGATVLVAGTVASALAAADDMRLVDATKKPLGAEGTASVLQANRQPEEERVGADAANEMMILGLSQTVTVAGTEEASRAATRHLSSGASQTGAAITSTLQYTLTSTKPGNLRPEPPSMTGMLAGADGVRAREVPGSVNIAGVAGSQAQMGMQDVCSALPDAGLRLPSEVSVSSALGRAGGDQGAAEPFGALAGVTSLAAVKPSALAVAGDVRILDGANVKLSDATKTPLGAEGTGSVLQANRQGGRMSADAENEMMISGVLDKVAVAECGDVGLGAPKRAMASRLTGTLDCAMEGAGREISGSSLAGFQAQMGMEAACSALPDEGLRSLSAGRAGGNVGGLGPEAYEALREVPSQVAVNISSSLAAADDVKLADATKKPLGAEGTVLQANRQGERIGADATNEMMILGVVDKVAVPESEDAGLRAPMMEMTSRLDCHDGVSQTASRHHPSEASQTAGAAITSTLQYTLTSAKPGNLRPEPPSMTGMLAGADGVRAREVPGSVNIAGVAGSQAQMGMQDVCSALPDAGLRLPSEVSVSSALGRAGGDQGAAEPFGALAGVTSLAAVKPSALAVAGDVRILDGANVKLSDATKTPLGAEGTGSVLQANRQGGRMSADAENEMMISGVLDKVAVAECGDVGLGAPKRAMASRLDCHDAVSPAAVNVSSALAAANDVKPVDGDSANWSDATKTPLGAEGTGSFLQANRQGGRITADAANEMTLVKFAVAETGDSELGAPMTGMASRLDRQDAVSRAASRHHASEASQTGGAAIASSLQYAISTAKPGNLCPGSPSMMGVLDAKADETRAREVSGSVNTASVAGTLMDVEKALRDTGLRLLSVEQAGGSRGGLGPKVYGVLSGATVLSTENLSSAMVAADDVKLADAMSVGQVGGDGGVVGLEACAALHGVTQCEAENVLSSLAATDDVKLAEAKKKPLGAVGTVSVLQANRQGECLSADASNEMMISDVLDKVAVAESEDAGLGAPMMEMASRLDRHDGISQTASRHHPSEASQTAGAAITSTLQYTITSTKPGNLSPGPAAKIQVEHAMEGAARAREVLGSVNTAGVAGSQAHMAMQEARSALSDEQLNSLSVGQDSGEGGCLDRSLPNDGLNVRSELRAGGEDGAIGLQAYGALPRVSVPTSKDEVITCQMNEHKLLSVGQVGGDTATARMQMNVDLPGDAARATENVASALAAANDVKLGDATKKPVGAEGTGSVIQASQEGERMTVDIAYEMVIRGVLNKDAAAEFEGGRQEVSMAKASSQLDCDDGVSRAAVHHPPSRVLQSTDTAIKQPCKEMLVSADGKESYLSSAEQIQLISKLLEDAREDAARARETANQARAAEAFKTKSLAEIQEQLTMQEAINARLVAEVEVLASQRKEHNLPSECRASGNGGAFGLREDGALLGSSESMDFAESREARLGPPLVMQLYCNDAVSETATRHNPPGASQTAGASLLDNFISSDANPATKYLIAQMQLMSKQLEDAIADVARAQGVADQARAAEALKEASLCTVQGKLCMAEDGIAKLARQMEDIANDVDIFKGSLLFGDAEGREEEITYILSDQHAKHSKIAFVALDAATDLRQTRPYDSEATTSTIFETADNMAEAGTSARVEINIVYHMHETLAKLESCIFHLNDDLVAVMKKLEKAEATTRLREEAILENGVVSNLFWTTSLTSGLTSRQDAMTKSAKVQPTEKKGTLPMMEDSESAGQLLLTDLGHRPELETCACKRVQMESSMTKRRLDMETEIDAMIEAETDQNSLLLLQPGDQTKMVGYCESLLRDTVTQKEALERETILKTRAKLSSCTPQSGQVGTAIEDFIEERESADLATEEQVADQNVASVTKRTAHAEFSNARLAYLELQLEHLLSEVSKAQEVVQAVDQTWAAEELKAKGLSTLQTKFSSTENCNLSLTDKIVNHQDGYTVISATSSARYGKDGDAAKYLLHGNSQFTVTENQEAKLLQITKVEQAMAPLENSMALSKSASINCLSNLQLDRMSSSDFGTIMSLSDINSIPMRLEVDAVHSAQIHLNMSQKESLASSSQAVLNSTQSSRFLSNIANNLAMEAMSEAMSVSQFSDIFVSLEQVQNDLNQLNFVMSDMIIRNSSCHAILQQTIFKLQAELKATQESEEHAYEKLKLLRESSSPASKSKLSKDTHGKIEIQSPEICSSDHARPSPDDHRNQILKLQQKLANTTEREQRALSTLEIVKGKHASEQLAHAKLQQELSTSQKSIEALQAREKQLQSELAVQKSKVQLFKDEVLSLEGRLAAEQKKSERSRNAVAQVIPFLNFQYISKRRFCCLAQSTQESLERATSNSCVLCKIKLRDLTESFH